MRTVRTDKETALQALAERLAVMPKSTDDLTSTWCPAEWEQVVEWWDDFVSEARKLTGTSYRNEPK